MRELFRLASPELTPAAGERWVELSRRTTAAVAGSRPTEINDDLRQAASDDPEAATAPAYLLWAAENLLRQGRDREAVDAFGEAATAADAAGRLLPDLDLGRAARHHRAHAAARIGAVDVAVEAFERLAAAGPFPAGAWFEAGLALEDAGRAGEAAEHYRRAADADPTASDAMDDPAELARRALRRLDEDPARFAPDVDTLARSLVRALEAADGGALRELASGTHLSAGPIGGHLRFEVPEILDRLVEDLAGAAIEVRVGLRGSGAKRYLLTRGWQGAWYRGEVGFVLTRSPRGWQWTGTVVTPTDEWVARWRSDRSPAAASAGEVPLPLRAPWPAGQHFTAGGLHEFIGEAAAVAAAGLVGGPIVAAGLAISRCGWGPRGFYYDEGPTHTGDSTFAIDFTRYRRFVPLDNESGGTPVLAVADGVVVTACGGRPSGDPSASNTVEVLHADPDTGADRFLSRYLHLAGPWQLPVSTGMAVRVGERLGRMDDTGNSALDHLHFSFHDQQDPFPGAGSGCGGITRGASVRPTPLDGVPLDDGDSNRCVRSSNVEDAGVRTVEGRVAMLRAHELGTGFGPDHDHLDGEVVVALDTGTDEWFGFRLRQGPDLGPARAMLVTLRQALATDAPVRLAYVRAGPSVRRIVRVERAEAAAVEAVAGAVTMLRVHEVGTGFGPAGDHLDAEVVVALDRRPDEHFGFRLRRGRDLAAGRAMLATLRGALLGQRPVTLEYVRTGPSVRRVLRVLTAGHPPPPAQEP